MLQGLLQMMQGVATTVALPAFSRLQVQPGRLRQLFYESSSLICLVSFPVFAGIIVTAPELVSVLFGQKWMASVPVLQVFCASGFVYAMLAPSGPMLMALNKPAWLLKLSILGAVVNLALLIPAAPWGIVAAAWAHAARSYLLAPLHFYAVARLLGTDWRVYCRRIIPSGIGALGVVGVALIARALLPGWLGPGSTLFILVLLGILTYAIVVFETGPELLQAMREIAGAVLRSPRPGVTVEFAGAEARMGATASSAEQRDLTKAGR